MRTIFGVMSFLAVGVCLAIDNGGTSGVTGKARKIKAKRVKVSGVDCVPVSRNADWETVKESIGHVLDGGASLTRCVAWALNHENADCRAEALAALVRVGQEFENVPGRIHAAIVSIIAAGNGPAVAALYETQAEGLKVNSANVRCFASLPHKSSAAQVAQVWEVAQAAYGKMVTQVIVCDHKKKTLALSSMKPENSKQETVKGWKVAKKTTETANTALVTVPVIGEGDADFDLESACKGLHAYVKAHPMHATRIRVLIGI